VVPGNRYCQPTMLCTVPAEVQLGCGLAYNSGRFATAAGVLLAGFIFTGLGGSYPRVGTICACVYAVGIVVIWFCLRANPSL